MMGDIAIRRVLSHVTKALSCPRSPVVTAPSCPLRHHSPASSLAVPAPDTMASSSETDSPSSTTAGSLHSLTRSASRRDGDELGANPLSPISSAPSVSSSQQSPSSLPMFPLTDSTATPGAKANSYTSASPEEAPNSADASPRSAADRQSACPFASAAKAKELGATAKSSNLLSSQAPEVATQPSSSKSSIGVEQIRPFNDLPCPPGWPILGSFVDYFKKENKGQMHELMVSSRCRPCSSGNSSFQTLSTIHLLSSLELCNYLLDKCKLTRSSICRNFACFDNITIKLYPRPL